MTVSYWQRTATWPEPRLSDRPPATADAVILGAGICGVSAAIHLERRGLSAVIVDRVGVAGGASGRNAGFLMRGCADNYHIACAQYGRERARFLWRLTEQNLEGLRAAGIDVIPTARRIPSCLLAYDGAERDELRESATLLSADGFNAQWIDPGTGAPDDAVWRSIAPPLGALVNPGDGAANSVDLLRFLGAKVKGPIVAPAAVRSVREEGGGVRVETDRGAISCARALVCTNAYAPTIVPALASVVEPRRGQMLALRPRAPGESPRALAMSYYANRGYEYFRQPVSADGTIVAGGWRRRFADTEVGPDDVTTEGVQRGIEGFVAGALSLRPGAYEITDRWSGVMGFSRDGLPKIVPLSLQGSGAGRVLPPETTGDGARAWFIGAYTGHGMSMGFETARLAVERALGDARGAENPFPFHVG